MSNIETIKPMTREEMAEKISLKTGYSKKEVKEIMTEYENVMLLDLATNHETKVGPIGKIKISERSERKGINPVTKERVILPAKLAPKFVFSKGVKEFVANKIKK
ncbi:HU family DNA-binding protein [Ureaplasma ceti]|uniref:DNA-binding protein HU n=1 Tax=Ureaplasma ceti TaxID=3119530 RepID=A0ABP9U6R4_9BACT